MINHLGRSWWPMVGFSVALAVSCGGGDSDQPTEAGNDHGAGSGPVSGPTSSLTSRPNILLLISDEQFADAMSAVMGSQYLNTPNMNGIAASGMRFTRAYAANPICVPSRSAMFTGRFPHQLGIQTNVSSGLDATKYPLMGKYFSNAGYETGYVGKWHIPYPVSNKATHGFNFTAETGNGSGSDPRVVTPATDFIRKPRTNPFLLVVSFVNPHDICEWARGNSLPDGSIGTPPAASLCPPLRPNNLPQQNEPDIMALLRRSYQAAPMFPVGNYTDDKWRQYLWAYYRMIELTDGRIGQVLQVLRETGQESNTVIVFTSDHGDAMGSHKWNQKTIFHDESARVPFIVSQKGTTSIGTSNRLVNVGVDLMPTLMEFAGIAKPAALPGLSLAKTALGQMTTDPRTYIVTSNKAVQGAPINGTTPTPGGRMVRSANYKYCAYDEGTGSRESLVDMAADPGEKINIASNPAYATLLAQHRSYLSEFKSAYADPFLAPGGTSAVRVNDADLRITYVSYGLHSNQTGAYNLDLHGTTTAGATATFVFNGTSISWGAKKGPGSGKSEVRIDGALMGTVDLYAPSPQYQVIVYRNTSLSSGTHTIQIRNTNTKNASASSYYSWIDFFEYR